MKNWSYLLLLVLLNIAFWSSDSTIEKLILLIEITNCAYDWWEVAKGDDKNKE